MSGGSLISETIDTFHTQEQSNACFGHHDLDQREHHRIWGKDLGLFSANLVEKITVKLRLDRTSSISIGKLLIDSYLFSHSPVLSAGQCDEHFTTIADRRVPL